MKFLESLLRRVWHLCHLLCLSGRFLCFEMYGFSQLSNNDMSDRKIPIISACHARALKDGLHTVCVNVLFLVQIHTDNGRLG